MIKQGKIQLLENIIVDRNLPKYNTDKSNSTFIIGGGNDNTISGFNSFSNNSFDNNSSIQLDYLEYIYSNAPTLLNKFKIWLYKKLYIQKFDEKEMNKLSPKDLNIFFESIKSNVNELNKSNIDEVLLKYNTVLENAEKNNQIAFIEKVKDYANVLKHELLLSTSKFNKYLTEEDVVKFYNVASKHETYKTALCLTYTKNFVKIIPDDVTKLRLESDELNVFDNYVIMHYDYSGKSVEETKEEKEKKKDPILFGVIRGSNKLYYIGDWEDEYCDLTLDVIIKTLGKEPEVIDIEKIKSNIDRI